MIKGIEHSLDNLQEGNLTPGHCGRFLRRKRYSWQLRVRSLWVVKSGDGMLLPKASWRGQQHDRRTREHSFHSVERRSCPPEPTLGTSSLWCRGMVEAMDFILTLTARWFEKLRHFASEVFVSWTPLLSSSAQPGTMGSTWRTRSTTVSKPSGSIPKRELSAIIFSGCVRASPWSRSPRWRSAARNRWPILSQRIILSGRKWRRFWFQLGDLCEGDPPQGSATSQRSRPGACPAPLHSVRQGWVWCRNGIKLESFGVCGRGTAGGTRALWSSRNQGARDGWRPHWRRLEAIPGPAADGVCREGHRWAGCRCRGGLQDPDCWWLCLSLQPAEAALPSDE